MLLLCTQIVLLITIFSASALLFFLAQHKKRTVQTLCFFLFIGSVTLWTFGILLIITFHKLWIESFIFGAAAIAMTAQYCFVRSYPHKVSRTWYDIFLVCVGMFFSFNSFVPGAIFTDVHITMNGYAIVSPGPLNVPYSLFSIVAIISSIYLLYRKRNDTSYTLQERNQLKILFYGFVAFFAVALTANRILPVYFDIHFFNAISPVFFTVLLLFIAHTIYYYDFLNIRSVIQRGTIYVLLAAFTVGLYILTIMTLSYFAGDHSVRTSHVSAGIAAILAVLTVPRLERLLRTVTNPWFFKDYYDYDAVLTEIYRAVRNEVRTDAMLQKVLTVLQDALYPQRSGLLIARDHLFYTPTATLAADQAVPHSVQTVLAGLQEVTLQDTSSEALASWMHENTYTAVLPIVFDAENIGCLLIGKKKSGDPFTQTDLQLLEQTALALGPALEKAHLFEQKQQQAKHLQQEVEKRTQQIHEIQASQETMMVNIAHTLKTPLTVLYGELSLLKKQFSPATWNSVRYAVENVSKSTSALLRLTRLEHAPEKSVDHCALLDCSALTEMIATHYAQQAEAHHIALHTAIAPAVHAHANHDDIEEVLMTLIENAIKYTRPRVAEYPEAYIDVRLTTTSDSVLITVADTGIGIAADDLERVFERFYRGEAALLHKISGSGVGLAICKMLIERNHGTIVLESTLGTGTTVTLTLPRTTVAPIT